MAKSKIEKRLEKVERELKDLREQEEIRLGIRNGFGETQSPYDCGSTFNAVLGGRRDER